MENICRQFQLQGQVNYCEPYGFGHINRTYLVVTDAPRRYILQKISTVAFKDVPGLMENIGNVTRYLANIVSDERECLHLVSTVDGKDFYADDEGGYWRVYDFVEGSICLQAAETPADFYQSAVAFGGFQRQLQGYPADSLHETIPHFHDTPDRYAKLKAAIEADAVGRAASAEYEIGEYLAREKDASALMDMLKEGKIPLRVTHNDTKLNNVMLDEKTREALCVIDLDTVMPGLMAFDFGDSIRFGAATHAEDEKDLSKVSMSMDLFTTFAKGFISAAPDMNEEEYRSLAIGAKLMTLECGARFLTDYLEGDHYFAVHREGHNLDRCRTQLRMVQDMESKFDQMLQVIEDIRREQHS